MCKRAKMGEKLEKTIDKIGKVWYHIIQLAGAN
jgi:hypothetical protein